MIALTLAGLVLLLQALFVLNVACDPDGVNSTGERVWAAALTAASLLGAFALFGWLG